MQAFHSGIGVMFTEERVQQHNWKGDTNNQEEKVEHVADGKNKQSQERNKHMLDRFGDMKSIRYSIILRKHDVQHEDSKQ